MITLDDFKKLPKGWMELGDCQALASYIHHNQPIRILEIGSFCGRSTKIISQFAPENSEVVAIDLWDMNIYSQFLGPRKLIEEEHIKDVFEEFRKNCPNAHCLRGSILDLIIQKQVKNFSERFDLCFIDADRRPDPFLQIYYYARSVSNVVIGAHFNEKFSDFFETLKKIGASRIASSCLWATPKNQAFFDHVERM